MRKVAIGLSLITMLVGAEGCKKDPVEFQDFVTPVPATYSFDNVSYSGQIERQDQLVEMTTYMKTAVTGSELDVAVLRAMFANTGENANGNFSFTSEKNLEDKCFEGTVATMDEYFVALAEASKSDQTAEAGVAGVMTSEDGSKSYLFDENGIEHIQLIEKGLMGAVFYYQATSVYLGDDKMNVDNETVVEGKGTEMEHHWDEAYGYFGVTNDFPLNTEDVRFWGKYCVGRDALLGTNESVSKAFREGRAGISVKRMDERDEAIVKVREEWENVCAGTAIHYLNDALDNMADDLVRNHVLSEAYAFTNNLFFNSESRMSRAEIDAVLDLMGDNFYEVSSEDLQEARDILAEVYGFENVKSAL